VAYPNAHWLAGLLLSVTLMVDGNAGGTPAGGRAIELIGSQTDAVHIWKGNALVTNLTILDKRVYTAAHRDAIQLIPPRTIDPSRRSMAGVRGEDWVVCDQMTGAILENVTVHGCAIRSRASPLQGIFGADGLFANLRLVGNRIQTAGEHFIAINGLLSGEIAGNTLQAVDGKTPVIHLYPARIGGNLAEEGMVYILDFAAEGAGKPRLQYGKLILGNNRLQGIPGKQTVDIVDDRFGIPEQHQLVSVGLKRFRYYAFMDKFSNLTFGEYRLQNGGKDFARLKVWLEQRIAEYSSNKRMVADTLPGIPAKDERRTHVLPILRKALANAINSHALDHVSLSNFPETPVRTFAAKQLAIRYGEVQPLAPLADQQMERRRQAVLQYLLPANHYLAHP
jgi:hypothetical protein